MRIGIDARYLSHGLVGGVHTYIAHFIPALIDLTSDHQLFLYADDKRPFELTKLPNHVTVRTLPYRNPLSSVYHDLTLAQVMKGDHLDVAHFPANYGFAPAGCRSVVTLHDVINILPLREIIRGHRKQLRTMVMMTYLHGMSLQAVRKADLLLTVSHHAQQEIAQQSGLPLHKIVPIPHAPTADLKRITDNAVLQWTRTRHGLRKPFVLADGLKNPGVLIDAWRLLPTGLTAEREIVFFTRHADPLPIVDAAVAAGIARRLVNPPRDDLIALYSMADAFVFPSWIEGFGLPVLEAMTCGAPVIASDRGAIPEVLGDAGLLADAEDADGFAQHLTAVLLSTEDAKILRHRGFRRAAQFSWHNTAQQILDSYRRAITVDEQPAYAHG
ncbi:glycosyltransferase [bacterium]|nr:glycosyltransferase [bacterium]